MNDESPISLLNAVLGLSIGEKRVLREKHFSPCTVHRYRDGWTVLFDHVSDHHPVARALLGWHFIDEQDLADFLTGALTDSRRFVLVGERIEL